MKRIYLLPLLFLFAVSSIKATELDKPVMPIGDTIVCRTSSIYYTQNIVNATSYQWVITPLSAGIAQGTSAKVEVTWNASYSGTATIKVIASGTGFSPATSDELMININPFPHVPQSPIGANSICQKAGIVQYQTTTTDGAISYNWSVSPMDAGVLTGTGTTCNYAVSPTFSGFAFLHVNSIGYCHNSGNTGDIIITVSPNPSIPTLLSGNTVECCQNQKITLSVNNVKNDNIYWFDNLGGSLKSGSSFNFEPQEPVSLFKVVAVNSKGCSSDSAYVTVNVQNIKADFFADVTNVRKGESVYFTNMSINAEKVTWLFGDGLTSQLQNTDHFFNTPGVYDVSLCAISHSNCKDTLIRKSYIQVEESITTGIDAVLEMGIELYPNPVIGILKVDTNEYCGEDELTIQIYSLCGVELVKRRLLPYTINEVNIQSLPAGIYMISLNMNGKNIKQKVIKSN